MIESEQITILCLASYFKGGAFLEACKQSGCRVILITKEKLADEPWPWQAIDERFLMPDLTAKPDIIHAVSYLARTRKIDRIIALDDFDVETAAALREHLRIPGMGETTARHFRDKLAMRIQAEKANYLVPPYVPVINHEAIRAFVREFAPPWVLKPRSQAGAMGIKKIYHEDEIWALLETLGDRQSYFVLEQFISGEIFHVDAIVSEREVVFAEVHKYKQPPLSVSHEGGVFISRTWPRSSTESMALRQLNASLLVDLGMVRGVTHSEFIQGESSGEFYFLETAARVGGANIAEMVEYATGVNLWREWARIELANLHGQDYAAPESGNAYAGVLVCLSRQRSPDLSGYNDPEVVWRLNKDHHAGLIVASNDSERVEALVTDYGKRFAEDFLAFAPPLDEAP